MSSMRQPTTAVGPTPGSAVWSSALNNIDVTASYTSNASVALLSQPIRSLPPDFDAKRPPPSRNVAENNNNSIATKHKLPECAAVAPCKTRKPDDSSSNEEHCLTCLQRKKSIDAMKRQLERLTSEDECQKLMYKKILDEYQLGKEILLAIMGRDVFNVIEENLEGPPATVLELLSQRKPSSQGTKQPSNYVHTNHSSLTRKITLSKPSSDLVQNVLELVHNSSTVEPNKVGPSVVNNNDYMTFDRGSLNAEPRFPPLPTAYQPGHSSNSAAPGYTNVVGPSDNTPRNQLRAGTNGYVGMVTNGTTPAYEAAGPNGMVPNITNSSSYIPSGPICPPFHRAPPPTNRPYFSQSFPVDQNFSMRSHVQAPNPQLPQMQFSHGISDYKSLQDNLQPSHPTNHFRAQNPQLQGPPGFPQPSRPPTVLQQPPYSYMTERSSFPHWPYK